MKLKISRKSIVIASAIVAVCGGGLIYYLTAGQDDEDVKAWTDSNWIYRKSIQVQNTGSTVNNEDVLVTTDTSTLVNNSKLQADCDDLRFVDSNNSTYLDYWIEDGCNTTSTKIWVRIPTLNSGGETIYMYYGNSSATSTKETWSGNVMMYADTTCPSGWTQASELNNKFLYGSSTYGTTGGADTYSHSNATCTSSSISTTNIAASSTYTIHTFNSGGTFVPTQNMNVQVLVVAGGGGSGGNGGGGGGGGGVVYSSSYAVTANTSYTVTVGAGGGASSNGGNSVFGSLTAIGGGAGGTRDYDQNGHSGGSGGGAGAYWNTMSGGTGTSGQGNSGGANKGDGAYGGAGGGGGCGGAGSAGQTSIGGNGGIGCAYSISGTSTYYGGGGGGGLVPPNYGKTEGLGGLGGGGKAAGPGGTGTAGLPNTGGGAGGNSASGGSGIVIVRYSYTASATGGNITSSSTSVSTTHTHASLTSSISSANSLPPYRNMVVCYNTHFLLSSGLISLFSATTPSGWTQFSALDNVFPRAASSYGGTGGSSTHTHTTVGSGTSTTTGTSSVITPFSATGGTVTYSGGYTIHTFTTSGTFTASGSLNAEILVVGGGGGGGSAIGGGGGAGGVVYYSSYSVPSGSTTVTIGGGGARGYGDGGTNGIGSNGGNSIFAGITAYGGGGGGQSGSYAGKSGASGGGGPTVGGVGYQGYSGGTTYVEGYDTNNGAGGGGGCGARGANGAKVTGGNGGTGCAYSISGTSKYYGGGGGGAAYYSDSAHGYGGTGGGGGRNQQNGTPNTGGGGRGGARNEGFGYLSGSGGSGIIIIRYPTSTGTAASSTHTHTVSNSTTGSGSSVPPYTTMIFGKANASVYVNENNILMTSSVPPLGWNRFTALDSKFVMGSGTYGTTGGATTHTHTVTNTTGGPSATISIIGSGLSLANSTHTHSCSVTSSSSSNIPSYYSVIYMQRKVSKSIALGSEERVNDPPNVPSSLQTEGLTNPTGILDLTPEFNAIFSDPNTTDTGNYYQIQVNTASNFTGTSMWDSNKTAFGTPIANGSRSSNISYAGTTLSYGATYYWRIKFWDNKGVFNEGPWSPAAQFRVNYIPNQPSSLLTEGLTNPTGILDLTPEFSAVFSDSDTTDTGNYYQIQVNTAPDFTGTSMWDSNKTAFGTPITNGSRSSDISYAGATLSYGTTYYWKIKFWDAGSLDSPWSSTAQFTVNHAPNQPSSLLTESKTNPTKTTLSPYFSAIFSDNDTNDTATHYQILVNTASNFTGTSMWNSNKTAFGTPIANGSRSPNIPYTGTTLSYGTTYYWKIKFWDNNDLEGTYSGTATFTTAGVPSAPTNLLTNDLTNPTIVNDYTPYFSAIYSDPNGDNATHYEIEINTNSSFTGTVIWDTGKTSTTITSGSRSPNYESILLERAVITYYWRIRFWDSDNNVSQWSSTASFTTSSTHFTFEGLKIGGIKLN